MNNFKTWANTHTGVKIAVYLLTFLFPTLTFAQFYLSLQSPVNPYSLMWIGFYSCLFLCWAYKGFWSKVPSVLANLYFMGFLLFGSLMGGLYGILLFLCCLCVPGLPLFFLF